jgi:YggT family protein
MQACRVSFNNQIGTFVVELTNWLVKPLRKALPGWYGLDLASLVPAYLLQVICWCAGGVPAAWRQRGLVAGPGCRCCSGEVCWPPCASAIYLLIGALLLQAVLSWINPYSPLSQPVSRIDPARPAPDPACRAADRRIDLSPLIAIVLAQLLLMFL